MTPTVEQIAKAAEDVLLYGQGYYKHIPIQEIYMPLTKRQPKPRRLTKDEQIAQLTRERDSFVTALNEVKRDLAHKSMQYDCACRDNEWLKDTIRQQIAAMKRGF